MNNESQRGFTLIEILIVLTFLSVVIGLAYNYNFLGTRFFSEGEKRVNVQRNIRLAADYISQQLRYSKDVFITEEKPDPFDDDYYYIYVNEDGQLTHVREGDEQVILEDLSQGLNFALTFSEAMKQDPEGDIGDTVNVGDRKTLSFLVQASGEAFSIDSSIFLDYLESAILFEESNGSPIDAGGVISYQIHDWAYGEVLAGEIGVEPIVEEETSGTDCGCDCDCNGNGC